MSLEEDILERISDIEKYYPNQRVPAEEIISYVDRANTASLRRLEGDSYILYKQKEHLENQTVQLRPEGRQLLRDKELIRHTKVSSASETVFTYALLTFSAIQLLGNDTPISNDLIIQGYTITILIASIFGLGNIVYVLQMRGDQLTQFVSNLVKLVFDKKSSFFK